MLTSQQALFKAPVGRFPAGAFLFAPTLILLFYCQNQDVTTAVYNSRLFC